MTTDLIVPTHSSAQNANEWVPGKIHHAYKVLLASRLKTTQALERLRSEQDRAEDVEMLVRFIETSERGVIKVSEESADLVSAARKAIRSA